MASSRSTREEFLRRLFEGLERFQRALKPATDPIYAVLRAHLFTEQVLDEHINSWLPRAASLLKPGPGSLNYSRKLELVYAFGVISEQVADALRALNGLRNRCAHQLDYQISAKDVGSIAGPLGLSKNSRDDAGTWLGNVLPQLASYLVIQVKGPIDK